MAAAKFKQYYQQMQAENKDLFVEFKTIHDSFVQDREKNATQFHQLGQKAVDKIREWDRKLCSSMGQGQYSSYTQKLSEKFWNLVRRDFELIDLVGVKSTTTKV